MDMREGIKIEKAYLNISVYDAFIMRMDFIFSEFDNIYIAFSGGKDSGTMLQLVFKYMQEHGINKRIGIFHQDFEAQYQKTTEFVGRIFARYEDISYLYWSCMPMAVRTALSSYEMYWYTWDPDKKDLWVREMPDKPYVYNIDNNNFGFYTDKMPEEKFYKQFGQYYHKKHNGVRTCCLVGICANESLHRYSSIVNKKNGYKGQHWFTRQFKDVYTAAPVYDWKVEDIWTAVEKFNFDYNHLYDLYYMAGVPLDKMRVASPFHDWAKEALQLYKIIEPVTWEHLLKRVDGVNFASIYAKTTAMAYRDIQLPDGLTWKQYALFLLSTLPGHVREQYTKNLDTAETDKSPAWKITCCHILKNDPDGIHSSCSYRDAIKKKQRSDEIKARYSAFIGGKP